MRQGRYLLNGARSSQIIAFYLMVGTGSLRFTPKDAFISLEQYFICVEMVSIEHGYLFRGHVVCDIAFFCRYKM